MIVMEILVAIEFDRLTLTVLFRDKYSRSVCQPANRSQLLTDDLAWQAE